MTGIETIMHWLLDLDHVRVDGASPLSLQWQTSIPLWWTAPVVALTAVVIYLLYRPGRWPVQIRCVGVGVRVSLIVLVISILCKPALRLQRDRTEPGTVALLIDTSQSMLIQDPVDAVSNQTVENQGDRETRIEIVRNSLLDKDGAPLRAMLAKNRLAVYAFGGEMRRVIDAEGAGQLAAVAKALGDLGCNDDATDVGAAIGQILEDYLSSGDRLAAIVVASDGRSNGSGSPIDAAQGAKSRGVPIYPLIVGSNIPRLDLAVGQLSASPVVFLKDIVEVIVPVESSGIHTEEAIILRLVNADTDETLAVVSTSLAPDKQGRSVSLRFKAKRAGLINCKVVIDPLPGEFTVRNNSERIQIRVIDKELRVLYVDHYPRYEYRFLKNALLREPTIRSSCILLSADAGFAQEGSDPIAQFPRTLEELLEFDVVLFGDVKPTADWLSTRQMEMLVQFVSTHGGGLGFLSGPRNGSRAFLGTPLEPLLAVQIKPSSAGYHDGALASELDVRLTSLGSSSSLFRFLNTDEVDGEEHATLRLGSIYWHQQSVNPKPGAEVFATAQSRLDRHSSDPLIVAGRYGGGRTLYCGTDDTWRWRSGGNEWFFDALWLQVCRFLMRQEVPSADRHFVLRTDRRHYRFGDPVEVRLDVQDLEVLSAVGESIDALVRNQLDEPVTRVELVRLDSTSSQFEGRFVPPSEGQFSISVEVINSLARLNPATTSVDVKHANLELRTPHADHDSLNQLATLSAGRVMDPDEVSEIVSLIPDRSVKIPDDIVEPIWDSKLGAILFLFLITSEWVLRRAFGMV